MWGLSAERQRGGTGRWRFAQAQKWRLTWFQTVADTVCRLTRFRLAPNGGVPGRSYQRATKSWPGSLSPNTRGLYGTKSRQGRRDCSRESQRRSAGPLHRFTTESAARVGRRSGMTQAPPPGTHGQPASGPRFGSHEMAEAGRRRPTSRAPPWARHVKGWPKLPTGSAVPKGR
jgi:hypothetical protein